MMKLKDVIGSKEASKELVIGKDTVYIHTNIRPYVEKNDDIAMTSKQNDVDKKEKSELYIYDEVQMSKDEYLEMFKDNVDQATSLSNDRIIDIESALTMLIGGM